MSWKSSYVSSFRATPPWIRTGIEKLFKRKSFSIKQHVQRERLTPIINFFMVHQEEKGFVSLLEKYFGFTGPAETCNGRVAMVGMTIAAIREKQTGKGIFEQVGLEQVQQQFWFLLGLIIITVLVSGGWYVLQHKEKLNKQEK
eukprot:jgi/Galph1/467/GphlegSOOS_G5275.1